MKLNVRAASVLLLVTTLILGSCRAVQPITNAVPCSGLESVRDPALTRLPDHVKRALAGNNSAIEAFCQ